MLRFLVLAGICIAGSSLTARAGLVYTCDASITDPNTCATLNSTIASLYTGTFNDVNAAIYIRLGATGLGASNTALNFLTFASYKAALTADKTSADDNTAVASLPAGVNAPAPLPGNNMILTNANWRALSTTLGVTSFAGYDSSGNFCNNLGIGSCKYDGVITISNSASLWYRTGPAQTGTQYDFFSVAEHETDEILGLSSCVFDNSGNKPGCVFSGTSRFAPVNLFRYNGNGARTFTAGDNASCGTAEATNACFSINGGVTLTLSFNNICAGTSCQDAGDYSTNCKNVQDAAGCQGGVGAAHDVVASAELRELDVIGYTAVPEPASVALLSIGLAAVIRFRRKCRHGA